MRSGKRLRGERGEMLAHPHQVGLASPDPAAWDRRTRQAIMPRCTGSSMATGSREPGVGCREAGVTVVELAVILVIIGVVALSLIPLVGNVMEVLRAKGAAEQVAATMRHHTCPRVEQCR